MGAELPRVSVFEADEMVQIQIVKKKLKMQESLVQ